MKKNLLFAILLFTFAWPALGQSVSQSLTFDDLGLGGGTPISGTYNSNDTFGFDVILTYSGYNSTGLAFWMETNNAFAVSLSITGVTYGATFPDATDTAPNPAFFNHTLGASAGYMTENRGCGSTINDFGNVPGPGTYFVAHITFTISGAAPGTYDLASTIVSPHASEVTSFDGTTFADNNLPAAHYSVTIVPEPATLGLITMGILGLGAILRRRKGAV